MGLDRSQRCSLKTCDHMVSGEPKKISMVSKMQKNCAWSEMYQNDGSSIFVPMPENFKVMDATKSMDRKEEGKEEEKGRKEGRKGGKGERKVLGGVRDGHVCLTLSDDG